jgi:formate hydrogenlyase subunit 6/NADH:ubiquinone oxidoreductase subunit I
MNIATMLKDVLTSLVQRPVTEKYPFERRPVPKRLRGMVTWDRQKCIGCGLCNRDCPSGAIKVHVLDRKAKRFVAHYQLGRCLFCAQCVQSCPTGALALSNERWELASLCKAPFDLYYGEDADVQTVLAGRTEQGDPAH